MKGLGMFPFSRRNRCARCDAHKRHRAPGIPLLLLGIALVGVSATGVRSEPYSPEQVGVESAIFPSPGDKEKIEVLELRDPRVIEPGWQFTYLPSSHPVLQRLREQEHLDDVIAPAKSHLEKVLLLKRWVGTQWRFGNPAPYPPWNALVILDWIRSGKTGGFCGQYAMVFLQALRSVGIQARYVELGTKANPGCHFTTEVWLEDFNKWAVVDATALPTMTCYYARDGVPQSALELHRALLDGESDAIQRIQDEVVLDHIGSSPGPFDLSTFYNFRIVFSQNQIDYPPRYLDEERTYDQYTEDVEWTDDRTVQWEESPNKMSVFPKVPFTARKTSNPDDLYWTLHRGTQMSLIWLQDNVYVLRLRAHFPEFSQFQVRLDGGEWTVAGPAYPYEMTVGEHTIEARALDASGEAGPVSEIRFRKRG